MLVAMLMLMFSAPVPSAAPVLFMFVLVFGLDTVLASLPSPVSALIFLNRLSLLIGPMSLVESPVLDPGLVTPYGDFMDCAIISPGNILHHWRAMPHVHVADILPRSNCYSMVADILAHEVRPVYDIPGIPFVSLPWTRPPQP